MTEAAPAQGGLLIEGGEALRGGAWVEAREHFEAALRGRETPEALEGLGMAAQWLADPQTMFGARERAYRLYRERQSPRDAARVALPGVTEPSGRIDLKHLAVHDAAPAPLRLDAELELVADDRGEVVGHQPQRQLVAVG